MMPSAEIQKTIVDAAKMVIQSRMPEEGGVQAERAMAILQRTYAWSIAFGTPEQQQKALRFLAQLPEEDAVDALYCTPEQLSGKMNGNPRERTSYA